VEARAGETDLNDERFRLRETSSLKALNINLAHGLVDCRQKCGAKPRVR